MIKRRSILIATLAGVVCSSLRSEEKPNEQARFTEFVERIEAIRKLQEKHGFREDLIERNGRKPKDAFDPNQYFEIFRHLKVKDGFVLDWVYESSELGGSPILYIRKREQPAFATNEEFLDSIRDRANFDLTEAIHAKYHPLIVAERKLEREKDGDAAAPAPVFSTPLSKPESQRLFSKMHDELNKVPNREYWEWWVEGIETDGTDAAFLELAALFLVASQFHLYWHNLVMDTRVVTTSSQRDAIIADPMQGFGGESMKREFEGGGVGASGGGETFQAQLLDPEPKIRREQDQVIVNILTFSKWGGFSRNAITFSAEFPHKILKSESADLVCWHCAIMF